MSSARTRCITLLWLVCACACAANAQQPPGSAAHGPSQACTPMQVSNGFELIVLGSGGPGAAGRAASSYLLSMRGAPRILVDVGSGSFTRLGESGLSTDALDTVLLTHLHIDHAGDLPGVLKSRDLSSATRVKFRVFGPGGRGLYPSTSSFVDRLFGAQGAFAYLPSFHNELALEASDLPIALETSPSVIFEAEGTVVSAAAVDHGDVPALAYRIEHAGRSVVISGDLASKRGQIEALAHGADVLVYDAAVLDPPGSPERLYALHTAPRRIAEVATNARVSVLVLSHITPPVEAKRAEVLQSIRSVFAGEVRFAADCMRLVIGAER